MKREIRKRKKKDGDKCRSEWEDNWKFPKGYTTGRWNKLIKKD